MRSLRVPTVMTVWGATLVVLSILFAYELERDSFDSPDSSVFRVLEADFPASVILGSPLLLIGSGMLSRQLPPGSCPRIGWTVLLGLAGSIALWEVSPFSSILMAVRRCSWSQLWKLL